jgi:hypothetical protein
MKLVYLVGIIIKKFVYDARSHVTMYGHMSRCTVTCHDARSHERKKTYVYYTTQSKEMHDFIN